MTILLAFLSSDKSFLLIFLISELKSDLSTLSLCLSFYPFLSFSLSVSFSEEVYLG